MSIWAISTTTSTYILSSSLEINQPYTLSVDGLINEASIIELWIDQTLIDTLLYDKVTFEVDDPGHNTITLKYSDDVTIERVKVELGTVANNWTSAPADLGLDKDLSFRYGTSTWILNGVAKHGWMVSNGTFTQEISLLPNTEYTLSGRVMKSTPAGSIRIYLSDAETEDVFQEVFSKEIETEFDGSFSHQFTTAAMTTYRLVLSVVNANSNLPIEITDLMLAQGVNYDIWSQASGESYTLNVRVDGEGITVHNLDGKGRTVMSPEEFAGYYNDQKIFTLNGDITEVMGLAVGGKGLFIPPVKFVQTDDSLDIVWTGR